MSFRVEKTPQPISQPISTRVVIVGAGPIGIELAVALKRNGIDFEIFEAGSIGHTISWWAPHTRWFSSNERIAIAGVPLTTIDEAKSTRERYLNYLRDVARQFELNIRTHTRITEIDRQENGFHLIAENSLGSSAGKQHIQAAAVVLAIGGTDRPKRLNIPGEELPHVDGYLREVHRYFNRRVLIIGGRNSAVEAALRLHHVGANVAMSYRGSGLPEQSIKYWLLPEIKSYLKSGKIQNFLGTVPVEIRSDLVRLKAVGDETGETIDVRVDDVLSLIGYEQDKSLLRNAGVDLIDSQVRPVFDEETMQTNVPGIYVAGTAIAGTQSSSYKVFVENCHVHVEKIVAHLMGRQSRQTGGDLADEIAALPES